MIVGFIVGEKSPLTITRTCRKLMYLREEL